MSAMLKKSSGVWGWSIYMEEIQDAPSVLGEKLT